MPPPADLDNLFRPLVLKDLRSICRARGLNPAGGKEQLVDRVKQHMYATNNFSLVVPAEGAGDGLPAVAPQGYQNALNPMGGATGVVNNNYARPGGQQNVGNFITDRPSSHVMAPPGGHSTIQLGGGYGSSDYQLPPQRPPGYGTPGQSISSAAVYGATTGDVKTGTLANNYARPGGQQNVGNFITDRPSSRVLAPPGGASQISFGDYSPPPPQAAAPANYGSPMNPSPYQQQQQYAQQQQQYGGYGSTPPPGASATAGYGYGSPSPLNGTPSFGQATASGTNNYARPGGQQNVGNFITDRPSSRVLAPPGGRSQISFG